MTSGLKTTKPSKEVLGLLLPGTQKYPHTTLEFLDNTGSVSKPSTSWGKTVLSEEMTQFLPLPGAQAKTLSHQCSSLFI